MKRTLVILASAVMCFSAAFASKASDKSVNTDIVKQTAVQPVGVDAVAGTSIYTKDCYFVYCDNTPTKPTAYVEKVSDSALLAMETSK